MRRRDLVTDATLAHIVEWRLEGESVRDITRRMNRSRSRMSRRGRWTTERVSQIVADLRVEPIDDRVIADHQVGTQGPCPWCSRSTLLCGPVCWQRTADESAKAA